MKVTIRMGKYKGLVGHATPSGLWYAVQLRLVKGCRYYRKGALRFHSEKKS